ncbi:amidophosphoribosyltransferase [Candidatus Poribacteria bacterium]|nr:MAG: amidophosphoribosyltransferase [Candidatus Poribacteria bacterium]
MSSPFDEDKPRDGCGVFGIYGHPDAAYLTYLGLYALQHRGQESAGIVTSDRENFHWHLGMGLVVNVFDEEMLSKLEGDIAIGHNRYSTAGSSSLQNAQPLVRHIAGELVAIAHNGNLVNAPYLRRELENKGAIFISTSDTEIIAHLIARSGQLYFEDRVVDALLQLRGAYSLLIMTRNMMLAARDPWGFRPLWMGRLGEAVVFASETCAFDVIKATPEREVQPGELIIVTPNEIKTFQFAKEKHAFCIFEYIYLSRPDSIVFGEIVNGPRRRFGMQLAREHPADADIVIPVPDSANISALGYSQESGIPFEFGLYRNQYVGRTFIQPVQTAREKMVNIKLNPIRNVVEGKRVVVVDDSIMRGTNCRRIVKMLRRGGAKEVHFRVSSPPNKFPCFYGIDTPTRQELIASSHTVEEIRRYIGADSLGYLSIEGMLSCVKNPDEFCTACFDGRYPVEFTDQTLQQLSIEFTRGRKR